MTYFSSITCGRINNNWIYSGCTTDYASSDAKYVVDAWANSNTNSADLVTDSTGYSVRLITVEELRNNLGYGNENSVNDNVPSWSYDSNYAYWSMSYKKDYRIYNIAWNGGIGFQDLMAREDLLVRPVITIKKSAL